MTVPNKRVRAVSNVNGTPVADSFGRRIAEQLMTTSTTAPAGSPDGQARVPRARAEAWSSLGQALRNPDNDDTVCDIVNRIYFWRGPSFARGEALASIPHAVLHEFVATVASEERGYHVRAAVAGLRR